MKAFLKVSFFVLFLLLAVSVWHVASAETLACSFTRSLSVGSFGEDVRCLQQYLNSGGFVIALGGEGSPSNETTYFGQLTEDAVALWQEANGINPATGYFGPFSIQVFQQIINGTIESGLPYDGYIVEFKEPPLLEQNTQLYNPERTAAVFSLRNQKALLQEKQDKFLLDHFAGRKRNKDESFQLAVNAVVLRVSGEEIKKIQLLPEVKTVHKNYTVHAILNDVIPAMQADDTWGLTGANNLPNTGHGSRIGIIDSGIDYTHLDFGGCTSQEFLSGLCEKVRGGYDFVNNDADPMDDAGHGTHVAGIAAGKADLNGNGVKDINEPWGVAPDASLYAYKVLNNNGFGSDASVIAAIERSIDPNQDGNISDHLDVINLSLGRSGNPDDLLSRAVDNAAKAGIVAAVSAGNSGPHYYTTRSPGTARHAITAASANKSDVISNFSSRGPVKWGSASDTAMLAKPDITAPGELVCSARHNAWGSQTCIDNNHIRLSGTSMAAPVVAGAAALVLQAHPDWIPEVVKSALKNSAIDLGVDPFTQGNGRLNVFQAVISPKPPIAFVESRLLDGSLIDTVIELKGTAYADNFSRYEILAGAGYTPASFVSVYASSTPVVDGILSPAGGIDISQLGLQEYESAVLIKMNVYDAEEKVSSAYATWELPENAPPLQVLSPNGGETLEGGKEYAIQWSGGDSSWKITVFVLDKVTPSSTQIAYSVLNTGSLIWTVPQSITPGEYYIRIICQNCGSPLPPGWIDDSDGSFFIVTRENLLTNGSFEEGQADWGNWGSNKLLTTETAVDGATSAKINLSQSTTYSINHIPFSIDPAHQYKVSGMIKTTITGSSYAYILAEWKSPKGNTLSSEMIGVTGGMQDWTRVEAVLTPPARADKLRIHLKTSKSEGSFYPEAAYFDVLRVEDMTAVAPSIELNVSYAGSEVVLGQSTVSIEWCGTGAFGEGFSTVFLTKTDTSYIEILHQPKGITLCSGGRNQFSTKLDPYSIIPGNYVIEVLYKNSDGSTGAKSNKVPVRIFREFALEVLSPEGGEMWNTGEVKPIMWTDPTGEYYAITLYSESSGKIWDITGKSITGKVGTNTLDWEVGWHLPCGSPIQPCEQIPSGDYRIKVHKEIETAMSGVFAIQNQTTADHAFIASASIPENVLTMNGSGAAANVQIQNPTDTLLGSPDPSQNRFVIQTYVRQGSVNRAGGGSVVYCGVENGGKPVLGVIPPGTCSRTQAIAAADTSNIAGIGTFIPGPATAVLQLKIGSNIVDEYELPVKLVSAPAISLTEETKETCVKDTWSCTDWNICATSGIQTRYCSLSFDCPGVTTSSPETSQFCTPAATCAEDTWTCGAWSVCTADGFQTRACSLSFDCSSVITATPLTTQSCVPPPQAYGSNLTSNGGFELGQADWNGWGANIKTTTETAAEGNTSAVINLAGSANRVINQPAFAIDSARQYKISGFIKTLVTNGDARIEADWRSAKGNTISTDTIGVASGATDWKTFERVIMPPANAAKLRVQLKATNGSGTVYFDDIQVKEKQISVSASPVNTSAQFNIFASIGAVLEPFFSDLLHLGR